MSEARTDFSVSAQDNLRKQFEEKNAVISIGMDHGRYHDAISFTIDLLRARGEQFTPVADAMAGGGEINYGIFLTSRMGARVTQDFPEVFAPDTNILGVPEAEYPQTRREQRAKAYEKWVKWRDNMENASKQAYAILRLAVENSSLEVIKTREGYEEANNHRDVIAFLNVLNQAIYSRDIPVNDRIIGIKAAKEMFELARRQRNGRYVERTEYLSTLKGFGRAVKSHGFDPLCTYEEMKGEIGQTIQNLLDAGNNDITNADQVMTHLSDWARVRSEENLARLAILNASNEDLIHTVLEHAIFNNNLNGAVPDTIEEAAVMIQLADKKVYKKLRKLKNQSEINQGTSKGSISTSQKPYDVVRTVLSQSKETVCFPPNVILLDTCSDICIVKNKNLVENLVRDRRGIRVTSDGGMRDVYDKGKFTHCKELEVWFHPGAFANVLSYSRISKIAKIKTVSNGFTVCWPSGKTWKCTTGGTHIYHYTLDEGTDLVMKSNTLQQAKSVAALRSVVANKRMYTKKCQKRAEQAKELEAMLAYPSTRNLRRVLETNVISNCPVTSSDVLTAFQIYGPNPEALVGKTTRRPSRTVELPSNDRYPVSLDPKYRRIVVCADVVTISTVKFLTTTIPTLKHSTATPIEDENRETMWDALRPTLVKYQAAGCVIAEFRGDGGFKCLKDVIVAQGVGVANITSRDEHEPHIERFHRTLEERVRCLLCTFVNRYELKQTFRFPRKVIIGAVRFSIMMINAITPESGISGTLSPGALFDNIHLNYNVHCRLRFLQYVQMHHESTNTMSRRTSAALNLGPTGDRQGNHYFYDIATNRVVERLIDKHTLVPMPEDIPAKLHKIGVRERMPEGIITNEEYEKLDYDEEVISMMDQEFVPVPTNPIDLMLGNDVEPISASELKNLDVSEKGSESRTSTHETQQPDIHVTIQPTEELSDVTMSIDDNDDRFSMSRGGDDRAESDVANEEEEDYNRFEEDVVDEEEEDRVEEDVVDKEEERHVPRSEDNDDTGPLPSHNHNLRPRKPRSYAHLFVQMGFKTGLKKFGTRAEDAIRAEFTQLFAK